MNIPIQEVFTYPKKSRQLSVTEGQVDLGVGASFSADLIDTDGAISQRLGRMRLTNDQYAAWAGDDAAVARFIAINLGLTPES